MLTYSKLLHLWHGMGPICPTTADHLAVQIQQNRYLVAVTGFLPFVLLVGGRSYSKSVSAGGKGCHMVISTTENTKGITETSLKPS